MTFRLAPLTTGILLPLSMVCLPPAHGATIVTFDLSLHTTDPGATYSDFHKAGDGTGSAFTVGFQIGVTELDGEGVDFGSPIATFCSELEEGIGAGSHELSLVGLPALARGRAGEPGTASSGIPEGGIGVLRSARVNYLFEHHYSSRDLGEWTNTFESPEIHAFQLALWEVTHDSDLDLSRTDGQIYLGAQGDPRRQNALELAQLWLDEIAAANVGADYVSQSWDIWALESVGSPGKQDILIAVAAGSPESLLLSIPEPSLHLLLIGAFMALCRQRHRGPSASRAV